MRINKIFLVLLTAFLLLLNWRAAFASDLLSYNRSWLSGPYEKTCYFTPKSMLAGNFSDEKEDELFIADADGYVHFAGWRNNDFKELLISEYPPAKNPSALVAADIDGDGYDEIVIADKSGRISAIAFSQEGLRILCSDCAPSIFPKGKKSRIVGMTHADFSGDSQDEIIVLSQTDSKQFMTVLKYSSGAFSSPASEQTGEKNTCSNIFPAFIKNSVIQYYLLCGQPPDPFRLTMLRIEEEGVSRIGDYFPPDKKFGGGVLSAGKLGESGIETEFFSIINSGKTTLLKIYTPGLGNRLEDYQKAPRKAAFFLPADLNGDGIREMFFADYSCHYEIHAPGALKTRLFIDDKETDTKPRLKSASGNRQFITIDSIPDSKVKSDKTFATVEVADVSLILDFVSGKALLKTPDSEENIPVQVDFSRDAGKIYIDPEAASQFLRFKYNWDLISKTMRLSAK